MSVYALIQSGTIVNTVCAGPSDPEDPSYTWVDITNYPTSQGYMPGIGWTTTDNINFTAPPGDS
jgi:hypothetical protein